METKGRVLKVDGPVERVKKDGTGNYTILNVDVQIGNYQRQKANYQSNTFETTTEPDTLHCVFLNDKAEAKRDMFKVGDVVSVEFHHYVNERFGRTEVVIDKLMLANVQQAAIAKQAAQTAAQPVQASDGLPF